MDLRKILLAVLLVMPAGAYASEKAMALLQVTLHLMDYSYVPEDDSPSQYKCDVCRDTGYVGDQGDRCVDCDYWQGAKPFAGYTQDALSGDSIVVISADWCVPCKEFLKALDSYRDQVLICVEEVNEVPDPEKKDLSAGEKFLLMGKQEVKGAYSWPQAFHLRDGRVVETMGSDLERTLEILDKLVEPNVRKNRTDDTAIP